jgi:POT family proton-dependent oligopeptide transporter
MNAGTDLDLAVVKTHVAAQVNLPESVPATIAESTVPTQDELNTLRRVSGKVPWTAYTVAVVELCERFSYYGTTAVCE